MQPDSAVVIVILCLLQDGLCIEQQVKVDLFPVHFQESERSRTECDGPNIFSCVRQVQEGLRNLGKSFQMLQIRHVKRMKQMNETNDFAHCIGCKWYIK